MRNKKWGADEYLFVFECFMVGLIMGALLVASIIIKLNPADKEPLELLNFFVFLKSVIGGLVGGILMASLAYILILLQKK